MAEVNIIAKADIELQFPIGKNMDDSRVDPYIQRAQQADLEPVLGAPLYTAFVEDMSSLGVFNSQNYQDLYDGIIYENNGDMIYFRGVKALLVSFAYSRLVSNNAIHVTRGGNVKKVTAESENQPDSQNLQKARDAVSDAIRLMHETTVFLDQERASYPLVQRRFNDTEITRRTSFNISKVPTRQFYRDDDNHRGQSN